MLKTPETLFVDVDGVLYSFVTSALSLMGLDPDTYFHQLVHWNAITDVVERELGISEQEFWQTIQDQGPCFWRYMPKTAYFDKMVELMEAARGAGVEVFILTSPLKSAANCEARTAALKANLPSWVYEERRIIFAHHKYLLAGENRVIFDDRSRNLELWEEHGGLAIRVSRPWNSKLYNEYSEGVFCHYLDTVIDRLKRGNSV